MRQIYCKEGTLCAKYPLEPRKIIKKVIASWIVLIIIVLAILPGVWMVKMVRMVLNFTVLKDFLFEFSSQLLLDIATLFILLTIIKGIYEIFYFKYYFYDLTEKELIIRKGVISRREVVIPFSRIQDIYVDQDFWDRIFGLYDIHVATAATGGYYAHSERAHIDGVNAQNAEALKKILLEKIRTAETTKAPI